MVGTDDASDPRSNGRRSFMPSSFPAQPWLVAVVFAALAAAAVLPFMASPYAPPELLTALALLLGALAALLGGPLPGLVVVLVGLGSVALVVDRPARVALALPVGVAMALVVGMMGLRHRRRENERDLALKELKAIRETAAEAIVDLDEDGAITSWNRGAEQIYGYAAEEIEGRPLSVLAAEERATEIDELLGQVREGSTVRRETVQLRADGKTFSASLKSMSCLAWFATAAQCTGKRCSDEPTERRSQLR